MSQKIDDVLALLGHMRRGYQPGHIRSLSEARRTATEVIAAQRGVTSQTIADVYVRRLRPDIDGTTAFDVAVRDWLAGTSTTLQRALENQALDSDDARAIGQLFR